MEKTYIAVQDVTIIGVKQGEIFQLEESKARFFVSVGVIKEQHITHKNMVKK